MPAKTIRHVGIVVSDMAASLHFYRDLIGMSVWADFEDDSPYLQSLTELPGVRVRMVKLSAKGSGSIELLQYISHPQPVPPARRACDVGCNHVSIEVDDLDGLHETLAQHGFRFHAPPAVSPDGAAKVAYCRDPEGVIVELVELL